MGSSHAVHILMQINHRIIRIAIRSDIFLRKAYDLSRSCDSYGAASFSDRSDALATAAWRSSLREYQLHEQRVFRILAVCLSPSDPAAWACQLGQELECKGAEINITTIGKGRTHDLNLKNQEVAFEVHEAVREGIDIILVHFGSTHMLSIAWDITTIVAEQDHINAVMLVNALCGARNATKGEVISPSLGTQPPMPLLLT